MLLFTLEPHHLFLAQLAQQHLYELLLGWVHRLHDKLGMLHIYGITIRILLGWLAIILGYLVKELFKLCGRFVPL